MDETTSAPSLRELSEAATLDERMKAAGMFTVAEMMGVTPMTRWEVHAGMTDLDAFGKWLDMKVSEYLRMRAAYDLGDKDESDELYEWVVAHSAAFSSIRTNFRAASERSTTQTEAVAAARAEGVCLKDLARLIRDAEANTMLVGPRVTISCETDAQARAVYDALESLLDATSS